MSQDTLRGLSEETGGFASVSSNDFSTAFQRIVDANSSYYVLGYYSTNEKRDGRFRKIEVRLARPGLDVNARKGYAAPRGKAAADKTVEASAGTSKELRDALNSPLQESALKLTRVRRPAEGAGVEGRHRHRDPVHGQRVRVHGEGRQVHRHDRDVVRGHRQAGQGGRRQPGLRRSVAEARHLPARPADGLPRADADSSCRRAPTSSAWRRATSGGTIGSVHYDLVVPDFAKEPLSISGIVVIVCVRRRRSHRRRHPRARRRPAGAADDGPDVFGAPTNWRCSPRSTTTRARSRTRSTSRRRSRRRAACRCSPTRRRDRARNSAAPGAGTATRPASR